VRGQRGQPCFTHQSSAAHLLLNSPCIDRLLQVLLAGAWLQFAGFTLRHICLGLLLLLGVQLPWCDVTQVEHAQHLAQNAGVGHSSAQRVRKAASKRATAVTVALPLTWLVLHPGMQQAPFFD
jgi:hypothetical protein